MEWNDANRIILVGDLSMTGVKEQHQLLVQYAVRLAEAVAAGCEQNAPLEIDLSGVQELDVCGCQLLAAFLISLRQCGATACSFKLDEAHRMKIHDLGFADEMFNGGCP